jgi:hypothetical protein
VLVLICVDYIILKRSSDHANASLLRYLNENLAIKDVGDLHFFLGTMEKKIQNGLLLTQEKYSIDLVHRVGMHICKLAPTPLSSTEKLHLQEASPLGSDDSTQYIRIFWSFAAFDFGMDILILFG